MMKMKPLVFSQSPLPQALHTCLSTNEFEESVVVNPFYANLPLIQDIMSLKTYALICVNGEYGLAENLNYRVSLIKNILQCKQTTNRLHVPIVIFIDKPNMELVEKFTKVEVDYIWHGLHVPTERDASFGNIIHRIVVQLNPPQPCIRNKK